MSGDPYFLHRYRRAEGSGPWLHPPRPARPARPARSIGLRYILLAALILAALTGSAMAAPIHHQPPVPVPVGLLLTIDPFEGRHSFSPADGIDAYAGGKTGHLTASPHEPRTVRWPRAGAWTATETRHPHYAGRIWGPPGYPVGFIGDCDCTTPKPPHTPAPVPLPAAGWLMLAGLGAILIKGKSYTTWKRLR